MYELKRINPNQTQVFFKNGHFETLTNEELDDLFQQMGIEEHGENELS